LHLRIVTFPSTGGYGVVGIRKQDIIPVFEEVYRPWLVLRNTLAKSLHIVGIPLDIIDASLFTVLDELEVCRE
jgi:hypothetical protein